MFGDTYAIYGGGGRGGCLESLGWLAQYYFYKLWLMRYKYHKTNNQTITSPLVFLVIYTYPLMQLKQNVTNAVSYSNIIVL